MSIATIVAPTGVEYKTDIKMPATAQNTEIIAEKSVTAKKLLKILIADSAGKIISADTKSAPTRFIAKTIITAIITAIKKLNFSTFVPTAFAKVSSKVTAKILL